MPGPMLDDTYIDTCYRKEYSENLGLRIRVSLYRLRKKCFPRRSVTSAAKAGAENKLVIAAVNRCATQKQEQTEFFRKLLEGPCRGIPP
jgi:hypothetical protein